MGIRVEGIAMVAAATFIVFNSSPSQTEETSHENNVQVVKSMGSL